MKTGCGQDICLCATLACRCACAACKAKPTPESERGDILRERRAQSIEVDWNMLLARGQDAQRTPGRKSRMWALLTEIDDGNPPRLREVAGFGFWAAVVVLLAVAVARC